MYPIIVYLKPGKSSGFVLYGVPCLAFFNGVPSAPTTYASFFKMFPVEASMCTTVTEPVKSSSVTPSMEELFTLMSAVTQVMFNGPA